MFAGLDDIDWSQLSHAYGSAEDVPGLLRDLAGPHPGHRQSALYAFHGNIWHQGTVYAATAAAVPFLLEIADAEGQGHLAEVLQLLANVGSGRGYLEVHRDAGDGDDAADRAREAGWVRATGEAVRRGLPVVARRLAHPDEEVRMSAACLLALCGPAAAPALRERLAREDSEAVAPVLAAALGRVADADAAAWLAATVADPETDEGLRLGAALGLSHGAPTALEGAAGAAFAAALERHPEVFVALEGVHDALAGASLGSLGGALHTLEPALRRALVPGLAAALAQVEEDAEGSVDALLRTAFAGAPAPADGAALDGAQRAALTAVLHSEAAWDADIDGSLAACGLDEPQRRRRGLAAYLGVPAPEGAEDEDDEDDDAVPVEPPELDDGQVARVARMVEALEGRRWREARPWFEMFLQGRDGGMVVQPPAIGRCFGAKAQLELGYWFHDEGMSEASGELVEFEHLRLAVASADGEGMIALRIGVDADNLDAVLAAIFAGQDEVSAEACVPLVHALMPLTGQLLFETGRRTRARLSRPE
jgi:hypothetical protein